MAELQYWNCVEKNVTSPDFQKWQIQMNKGYLELCVLMVLRHKGRCYGGEMLAALGLIGLEVTEGTLYPLLNRMHKNGWLRSEWVPPADGGHPRRYYELTSEACEQLPEMLEAFERQTQIIERYKSL